MLTASFSAVAPAATFMRSSESVVEVFTIRPPSPAYTPPPVNVPVAGGRNVPETRLYMPITSSDSSDVPFVSFAGTMRHFSVPSSLLFTLNQ